LFLEHRLGGIQVAAGVKPADFNPTKNRRVRRNGKDGIGQNAVLERPADLKAAVTVWRREPPSFPDRLSFAPSFQAVRPP